VQKLAKKCSAGAQKGSSRTVQKEKSAQSKAADGLIYRFALAEQHERTNQAFQGKIKKRNPASWGSRVSGNSN